MDRMAAPFHLKSAALAGSAAIQVPRVIGCRYKTFYGALPQDVGTEDVSAPRSGLYLP